MIPSDSRNWSGLDYIQLKAVDLARGLSTEHKIELIAYETREELHAYFRNLDYKLARGVRT
jgi:hypothetical protein